MPLTREEALELLKECNKEPFHIEHGVTVGRVLRWYAERLGWELDRLPGDTLEAMKAFA